MHIQYLSFCDWLIAFNIMSSQFTGVVCHNFLPFLKKNVHVYFLKERERETECKWGRGRQREREEDTEAGSRRWAVSTEPNMGLELMNSKIMTWTEVWRLTNWATQVPQRTLYWWWVSLVWQWYFGYIEEYPILRRNVIKDLPAIYFQMVTQSK